MIDYKILPDHRGSKGITQKWFEMCYIFLVLASYRTGFSHCGDRCPKDFICSKALVDGKS